MQNIIFIDIETVCCVEQYSMLDHEMKGLWDKKSKNINKSQEVHCSQSFRDKGAIYSEFGKIIVIAIGYLKKTSDNNQELRIKALTNEDESQLLCDFKDLIERFNQTKLYFCGHNIKEFDIPYICRRMIVNSIDLPACLNLSKKKPWEIKHLDTMEMWSFGDRKNFTSLHLLATILGVKSSKENMDGGQVHEKFYKEKNLNSIVDYCREDVAVVAELYFRMKNLKVFDRNKIVFV